VEVPFLHVFPYSERAGTAAARMPSVPVAVRRERAALLREAGRVVAGRFLGAQVGRAVSVLTERANGGHSEHFAPVRLAGPVEAGRVMAAHVVGVLGEILLAEAA
jgi:threonylcarbamoyladenosine tRNA methylthiotransferase MtaB